MLKNIERGSCDCLAKERNSTYQKERPRASYEAMRLSPRFCWEQKSQKFSPLNLLIHTRTTEYLHTHTCFSGWLNKSPHRPSANSFSDEKAAPCPYPQTNIQTHIQTDIQTDIQQNPRQNQFQFLVVLELAGIDTMHRTSAQPYTVHEYCKATVLCDSVAVQYLHAAIATKLHSGHV